MSKEEEFHVVVDCERPGCHEEALPPHVCPYAADINDDHETKCTCCEKCSQECADDI